MTYTVERIQDISKTYQIVSAYLIQNIKEVQSLANCLDNYAEKRTSDKSFRITWLTCIKTFENKVLKNLGLTDCRVCRNITRQIILTALYED
jgi:hypothetical protein